MRLKTLIAAAAMSIGLLAHADYADKAMSFESMTAGEPATKATLEAEDSDVTWDLQGNTDVTVKAYGEEAYYEPRATQLDGGSQNNYLVIKTPLTNGIVRAAGATIDATKGFYVDTLVKFTAADAEDDLDIPTDGKIAVWVKAMNEEGTENHIMISAGPVVNDKPTTYDCGVIDNLDAWHRLTIKVIRDVTGGDQQNGLVVYLDAKSDSVDVLWSEDAKAAFAGMTLTDVAAEYKRNGQLFPAMQNSTTLASVEFAGQGSVDDIVYTETQPAFAADPMIYTVAWEAGVTAFDYTPYGAATVSKTGLTEAGADKIAWDGVNAPEIDESSITVDDEKMATVVVGTGITTIKVSDLVATALINGEQKSFSRIEDLLTELETANTASVTLGKDIDKGLVVKAADDAVVTIDLAGRNITATADDEAAITVDANFTLYVTNSVEKADGGIVDGTLSTEGAVYNPSGFVYLQAGTYEGLVDSTEDYSFCSGGLFSAAENGEGETCFLHAVEGKTFELQGEYFACVDAVTATATVIFVCDKTDFREERSVTAGEQYSGQAPDVISTVGTKTFYTVTAWKDGDGNVFAPFTPVADETYTFTAELDINLTVDGDGAYQVGTVENLVTLQSYVADGNNCAGMKFVQTANIDMGGAFWTGIGASGKPFNGIYDGDNKELTNVAFSNTLKYGGFFAVVEGGEIKNLTVRLADVPFGGETPASEWGSAAIVGKAKNAVFTNLKAYGDMEGGQDDNGKPNHKFGGLIASAAGPLTINDCTNYMNVAKAQNNKCAGILVIVGTGLASDNLVTLNRCANFGSMEVASSGDGGVGGMCGYVGSGKLVLNDCVNAGTISWANDKSSEGQLVGQVNTSSSLEATGCTADMTKAAVGWKIHGVESVGLKYALDDAFVANDTLAAGNTYKTMIAQLTPTFVFEAAGTIAFNTNVCPVKAFAITAKDESGLEVTETEEGGVVTFTAAAPAPVNPIIKPDGSTEAPADKLTKEDAEAWAADNVKVESPNEAVVTTDAFTAYFKFTASGEAAPFTISAELIDDVVKAENETEAALTQVLALTEAGSINLTNAKPGLMYALKQGNKLEAREATAAQMADKDGKVSLSATKWADAGFYQILVTAPIKNN